MNIKFPRNLDIDYVRIVIGEGAHTESVEDERVYMLFAGYKDGHHFDKEKTWMKAKVPFRFTVVGRNGKRPSAINLHYNNAYGFMTMLATNPKSLHLSFWYDNASNLTSDRGLACQSLIVSSRKNQIELDNLIKKAEYEQFNDYSSVGMVNLDKNYPKFYDLKPTIIELKVAEYETEPLKMRKYKLGDKVYGFKEPGRKYHGKIGTLVDAYVTINRNYNVWKNPAYVVRYPDGEERTWQWIRHVFVGDDVHGST